MKLEDIEVNECYTRFDDKGYLVLYKTHKWFVCLEYSSNHKIACPMIYDQAWLDEEFNKKLVKDSDSWLFHDFLDCLEYKDPQTLIFN